MGTYLKEGMVIKPNINNMEYYFSDREDRLVITQVLMDRVFAKDEKTGEYLGEIGSYKEIEYYYDVVE